MTGLDTGRPGLWFPDGGWARAPSIVRAWLDLALASAGSCLITASRVERIASGHEGWIAADSRGTTIAVAPVVVLANAVDLSRLAPVALPIRSVRGQASYLPADAMPAPRAVVIGNGYLLPPVDGRIVVGSSYDLGSDERAQTLDAHEGNLARLRELMPGAAPGVDPRSLDGGVGFRAVAPDRMPVVGALAGDEGGEARVGLYAMGAFASRGLTWAALMGEVLAARVAGEPLPIEADLAEAVDPSRFLRRARRRAPPQASR